MTFNLKILILLFVLICGQPAKAFFIKAQRLNQQALTHMQQEKPELAFGAMMQALAEEPDRAELHYNLGLIFEALGKNEQAIQSYQTSDRLAENSEVQFRSRFNQGALWQKTKKVDEALAAYHLALDVNPTSKETKINIELLIQDQDKNGQGKNQEQQNDQQKNQDSQGKNNNQENSKDPKKDQQKNQNQDQKEDNKNNEAEKEKQYAPNKPQPKPFKSEDLSQSDVNKILGELRNQEQRIRSEYNKKEVKERPRGKDW